MDAPPHKSSSIYATLLDLTLWADPLWADPRCGVLEDYAKYARETNAEQKAVIERLGLGIK